MSLVKQFFSFYMTIALLAILAIGAAVATFIENDFGVETSKVLVYNSTWYEWALILTAVNMAGIIYRYKMWRNKARFILHLSFIVILIGAGLTRYFGYEGILHIREGQSSDRMISTEPYLQIEATVEGETFYKEYPMMLPAVGGSGFDKTLSLKGRDIHIHLKKYTFAQQNGSKMGIAKFDVSVKGETKEYTLVGTMGMEGRPQTHRFGDMKLKMVRGSKPLELPFSVYLREFDLKRYPGSMSPSSYASEVTVKDGETVFDYRIFMNNTLNYGGYKFFQSSYDQDERGTVLSVNKDPGKIPTYIGYFLLTLGFLMNLFDRKSRFARLSKYLKSGTAALLLALLLPHDVQAAQEGEDLAKKYVESYTQNSKETARLFGELITQDRMGRMKPVNTLTTEILNKLARKSEFLGMNSDQVVLGMMTAPEIWQSVDLIKVKHPRLKKLFDAPNGYIAFNDGFGDNGEYRLKEYVEKAVRKKPTERGTFDKGVIKLDERLNITYMVFNGSLFKIFPKPNDPNHTWYPPLQAMQNFAPEQAKEAANLVQGFFGSVIQNNWDSAEENAKKIKAFQKKYGAEVMPSQTKIELELFTNKAGIFPKLTIVYVITGLILLVLSFIKVFKPRMKMQPVQTGAFYFLALLFLIQTAAMGLRWYISGHAPWSDSYESMLYIAWSAMFAGIVFFRKSFLALAGTVIMAGVFMFSAHLSWVDPQITNLVPVLKSFWLTIHVSIITGSYGFLALGAILGFLALVLFIFRDANKPHIDAEIKHITAINEMTLIIGLSLLTVGNFLGGVWANESWGRYWGWDPKETWAYISIVVYAIVIHLRFIKPLNNPFVFSTASLLAFASILMTYYGVNFYLSGMHSYASGDPVPIPVWVYVVTAGVFATIALAYRKRDLGKIL